MNNIQKNRLLRVRRWRIRKKVNGTQERPRMSVKFTNMHIYVQFIDDETGKTLAWVSTNNKDGKSAKLSANVKSAVEIGKKAAEAAKAAGITKVVFDRNGAVYHGKVKALADAARETGLVF
ncbi:MAG: 50S ribosomal protein L18 [Verrucomicrobia bacterium]|nr:50S ribosomal protein L18 [Verrucomicrobiota bacterium]MBO4714779.1 50S ribosomal protein L18 [Verrucomicrobiota bacterium]MBR5606180.1 50S ribosomal protein L18 [Verrucomicrobiota bacterium]MBR5691599.1 50S ribosomal protein L18 [Verrucomicrobiota bacterium]MBR5737553.1 50S ribosomal protein L18 [Verrucomicrobiota bacterium]